MADMYMNGDKPFLHPVTGQLVGAYQWYEGAAHVESEQIEVPVEEPEPTVEATATKTTKRGSK